MKYKLSLVSRLFQHRILNTNESWLHSNALCIAHCGGALEEQGDCSPRRNLEAAPVEWGTFQRSDWWRPPLEYQVVSSPTGAPAWSNVTLRDRHVKPEVLDRHVEIKGRVSFQICLMTLNEPSRLWWFFSTCQTSHLSPSSFYCKMAIFMNNPQSGPIEAPL